MIDIMKLGLGQARPNKNTSKTREEVLESSAVDNAPPKSSYPNPILYEKRFGYVFYWNSSRYQTSRDRLFD